MSPVQCFFLAKFCQKITKTSFFLAKSARSAEFFFGILSFFLAKSARSAEIFLAFLSFFLGLSKNQDFFSFLVIFLLFVSFFLAFQKSGFFSFFLAFSQKL